MHTSHIFLSILWRTVLLHSLSQSCSETFQTLYSIDDWYTQWRARLRIFFWGGAFEGQTHNGGGGQNRIFKKVLLFSHAVVTKLCKTKAFLSFLKRIIGVLASLPFRDLQTNIETVKNSFIMDNKIHG